MKVLTTIFLLAASVLGQQTSITSEFNELVTCSRSATIPTLRHATLNLDRFDDWQIFVARAVNDDPDGCCIQWVPGQAKGCSQTKQKQCKEDADAVNAKWSWHAGACVEADGCH